MKVKDYLDQTGQTALAFSVRIGCAPSYLSQMIKGAKPWAPQHATAVELATKGQVTRRELRPTDWGDIWPELIDEQHPWPVQTTEVAA